MQVDPPGTLAATTVCTGRDVVVGRSGSCQSSPMFQSERTLARLTGVGSRFDYVDNGRYRLTLDSVEPRVALYQLSYIVSLLLGSVVYDSCSQLDKALMVFLLMSASVACWGTLFLAELPPYVPPPPAAALWSLAPLSRLAAWAPPLPRLHLSQTTHGNGGGVKRCSNRAAILRTGTRERITTGPANGPRP